MIKDVTIEEFDTWSKSDEAKKILGPLVDRAVSSAIATYSKNHPSASDVDARLAAIEAGIDEKEAENKKLKLDNYLFKKCVEHSVPFDLLADFPFEDEKSIDAKIESFSETIAKKKKDDINELMAESSHRPGGGGIPAPSLKNLSLKEAEYLERTGGLNSIIRSGI